MRIILLLLLLVAPAVAQYWTADANTLLHIDFEGEIIDAKGHTLETGGTLPLQDGAKTGTQAAYWDGNSANYLRIPSPSSDDLDFYHDDANGFTLQILIKFDYPADIPTSDYIFWKRSGLPGYSFSIANPTDTYSWWLADGTTNTLYSNGTPDMIDGGEWYLLTSVFDNAADTLRLYINGEIQWEKPYGAYVGSTQTTTYLYIGRTVSANSIKGWVDVVTIWGDKRTLSEIQADYQAYLGYSVMSELPFNGFQGFNGIQGFEQH